LNRSKSLKLIQVYIYADNVIAVYSKMSTRHTHVQYTSIVLNLLIKYIIPQIIDQSNASVKVKSLHSCIPLSLIRQHSAPFNNFIVDEFTADS